MNKNSQSNQKTVLITGSSSGIGKSTAKHFADKGWNVVATMRNPQKETELIKFPNILLLPLDVTDKKSIQKAIDTAIQKFGKIDVFVNNAGFALMGPFETAQNEQITKQFNVNLFGLFDCTQAILSHFRKNKSGTIINISSMGGRLTFPYFSLYHSTKWAVDGFSESLWYELRNIGIKVKIVEPGAIKTDFYSRSKDLTLAKNIDNTNNTIKSDYKNYFTIQEFYDKGGKTGSNVKIVAKKVYKAATDNNYHLRYVVGLDAKILLFLRWLLPNQVLFNLFYKLLFIRK